jgi:RNA polymerase sigma-70 factor (ECF subfamily)
MKMSNKNNKSSLSDIFVKYQSTIRSFIGRIVKPSDIDDIVQETFVRSYEANLKQEIQYARSYMLKTAKNLALNHNAKWDNKYNDSIEDFIEPPVELRSTNFEEDYESKERFLVFCQATDQLSGSVRKCFILKKVYGLSQKEIAQYLQLSESTVEKHIAKGLLKSKQFMEQKQHNISLSSVSNDKNIPNNKATVISKNIANK